MLAALNPYSNPSFNIFVWKLIMNIWIFKILSFTFFIYNNTIYDQVANLLLTINGKIYDLLILYFYF